MPEQHQRWEYRECNRFLTGRYKHPVWQNEVWWVIGMPSSHYAHVSEDDPRLIAYTPNSKYGEQDRQVKVRPGKYLKQFFPDLDDQAIEKAVAMWKGNDPNKLKIATTREEIREVYLDGPRSCMSYDFENECGLPAHPCETYAAGDYGVAYFEGVLGKPQARTIVLLEEKKYWPCRYGEAETLEYLLNCAKWKISDVYKEFTGYRLLKIPDRGGWLVPYCDFAHEGYITDDYIYTGSKPRDIDAEGIALDLTSGTTVRIAYCQNCEEPVSGIDPDWEYCEACMDTLIVGCFNCGHQVHIDEADCDEREQFCCTDCDFYICNCCGEFADFAEIVDGLCPDCSPDKEEDENNA